MLVMDGSHKGLMGLLPSELGHHFKYEIHTSCHGRSLIDAILSGHDAHDEFLILGTAQAIAPTPWTTRLMIVFLSSIYSTRVLYGIPTAQHNIWSERSSPFESYQDRPGIFTKSVTLSEVAGAGCTACTTRHAHCNKYYYNIEFQIVYAYMLLIY
jgi:hypothetical protein